MQRKITELQHTFEVDIYFSLIKFLQVNEYSIIRLHLFPNVTSLSLTFFFPTRGSNIQTKDYYLNLDPDFLITHNFINFSTADMPVYKSTSTERIHFHTLNKNRQFYLSIKDAQLRTKHSKTAQFQIFKISRLKKFCKFYIQK